MSELYDVIVVGGGPAGLSAALLLGRSRRRVIVFDSGHQRNLRSQAMHGYLTRDGIRPQEFLAIGRGDLDPYDVEVRDGVVSDAVRLEDGRFQVELEDGTCWFSRKMLLATGVVDDIPELDGIQGFYGRSVFHCPYCDGWETRDRPLAVYGRGKSGVTLSSSLKLWSPEVTLMTDGARLDRGARLHLERCGVDWRREKISRLTGEGGRLEQIEFADGEPLRVSALFFTTGHRQRSDLPLRLGCRIDRKGCVATDRLHATSVRGLYAVGDIDPDMQLVIVAAAEGARAAISINRVLIDEDSRAEMKPPQSLRPAPERVGNGRPRREPGPAT